MAAARAKWLDKVRKQAQVFASAWALVGSRFDEGGELDNATHQRDELMRLVEAGPQLQPDAELEAFEAWCVEADFARRLDDGSISFHRYGGDGMWDAWQAGRRASFNG